MNGSLMRLADAHGIATEYHDIWGNLHAVSDATLTDLLGAMGVRAGVQDADALLRALEDERDTQRIPPMIVLRENVRPWTITLRLPPALASGPLDVRVTSEDGADCGDAAVAIVARTPPDRDGACTRLEVALTAALAPGYHRIAFLAGAQVVAQSCCAVAPADCYRPATARDGRRWGVAAQLYGVRSDRNWGIGDFTDLASLVYQWGARGAGVIGVNPLHALFPAIPERISPYSPSSRLFRNILYIDVEAVAEMRECEAAVNLVQSTQFQQRLAVLRSADLVDYVGVATAKLEVLELLYRHFRQRYLAGDDARSESFRAYVIAGGAALRRHALFDALHEFLYRDDRSRWGWPAWPERYRHPDGPAVERFAADHAERIEFHAYLQWQAEQQMAMAAARAKAVGLDVGLYTDLAVSVDRGGAEAWSAQGLYAFNASIGAPPDSFSTDGQDWGLPPMIPGKLRDSGYAPFLAILRANMRHAGALRIDHVMGLSRLFWIPLGKTAAEGTYVRYPLDDLLGLVALESHRHRCLVIGEDLGTVSPQLREALAANGVLSYRVLMFERDAAGEFVPPGAYPAEALATSGTHDLPTLVGWWTGADIEARAALGLIASAADRDARLRERDADRRQLLAALDRTSLLPPGGRRDPSALPVMDDALARAVQAYLAESPARLHIVQLEDVSGTPDQANVPGTVDTHPNWRRKLPLALEASPGDVRFDALAEMLAQARPRPHGPPARAVPSHVPLATYRVQLSADFTFVEATALVPYLARLGISHVYCSPYLRARAGSRHGYDVVDHRTLNPEIGTRADFERFVAALAEHDMGHICDVVPNHVGVMGADNAWWLDVLEHGAASECAEYFDIDWSHLDSELAGRVLVPVLGAPYGIAIERGEVQLTFDRAGGALAIAYFGHRFPVDPREYPRILAPAFARVEPVAPPEIAAAAQRLIALLKSIPPRSAVSSDAIAQRRSSAAAGKRELAALAGRHRPLADAISDVVEEVNGTPGNPASFTQLHALLDAQAFRLAYWRVASDEINYRRFFDINDLAALRMENEAVFEATHGFILDLAAAGKIHGFRIDHPDGLLDPAQYFQRLQEHYRERLAAAGAREGAEVPPLFVVLEKILADGELLPAPWPVSGTTGYRFSNLANGLFVAPAAKDALDRVWRMVAGDAVHDFATAVERSKRAVMRGPLAADLTMLTRRALRAARGDPHTRDFTANALRRAIEEITARFPVYRTYVAAQGASTQDLHYIDQAVVRAQRESQVADPTVFAFLRSMMLGVPERSRAPERIAEYRAFAMRYQQFTAPVAAKGVEDSVFYTFNRLVSLNDVGGDPERFGTTVEAFHAASQERIQRWPATMLATSTHDGKRSEDVRARIDVISEMPAVWQRTVRRWNRLNRRHQCLVGGRRAPSANEEYLLYQTLVGTFMPRERDREAMARYRTRIEDYMVKAAREGKARTSWLSVDIDYEQALVEFVRGALAPESAFVADLRRQCSVFAWFGLLNSLSLALVKFASPGIPDLYQENEMLALRLVDPDNRVRVDFAKRQRRLDEFEALAQGSAADLARVVPSWFSAGDDGLAKLWITYRALRYRRAHPQTMARGDYLPVPVRGKRSDHVIAFARRDGNACVIAVAGRMFASLGARHGELPAGSAVWGDTALEVDFLAPGTHAVNILTNESLAIRNGRIAMADLFRVFPAALLHCVRAP